MHGFHYPLPLKRMTEDLHLRMAGIAIQEEKPPPPVDSDSDDSIDAQFEHAKLTQASGFDLPRLTFSKKRSRTKVENRRSKSKPPPASVPAVIGVPLVGSSVANVRATKIEQFEVQGISNSKLPLDWASAQRSLVQVRRSKSATDYLQNYRLREYMTLDEVAIASQALDRLEAEKMRALRNQKIPDWALGGGGFGVGASRKTAVKVNTFSKYMKATVI
jgi:hypothetical protein